jgi:hypothetical protein
LFFVSNLDEPLHVNLGRRYDQAPIFIHGGRKTPPLLLYSSANFSTYSLRFFSAILKSAFVISGVGLWFQIFQLGSMLFAVPRPARQPLKYMFKLAPLPSLWTYSRSVQVAFTTSNMTEVMTSLQ